MKRILTSVIAVAGLILAEGASASFMLEGSEFTNGLNNQVFAKEGGANMITATSTPGFFNKKTAGGIEGVGITGGRTNDEIDWIGPEDESEALEISFQFARQLVDVTVGVLFDGPEFGDFQEVAQITINEGLGDEMVGTLTTQFVNLANGVTANVAGDLAGATVTNISPAVDGFGAVWTISDLFVGVDVQTIKFTALEGTCGTLPEDPCTNQSDYTFVKLTAASVPEPATVALFGVALALVGFATRRRQFAL